MPTHHTALPLSARLVTRPWPVANPPGSWRDEGATDWSDALTTRVDGCDDTLTAGEVLAAGQQLQCPSREYSALMRGDGELVLYRDHGGSRLWASGTAGHRGGLLAVHDDGDVAVCAGDGRPVWSAGTSGNPGAFVQLHDDGRLVVRDFYRELLWSSTAPR